jgi:hypothetical protein
MAKGLRSIPDTSACNFYADTDWNNQICAGKANFLSLDRLL